MRGLRPTFGLEDSMRFDRLVMPSGGFTPADISGLRVWLPAYRGITLNTTNVAAWADQSGNGNDVTPPANQPPFLASALNGHPAVSFTIAGNAPLISASAPAVTTNAYTMAVVYRPTSTTNGLSICNGQFTPGRGSILNLTNTTLVRDSTHISVSSNTDAAAANGTWEILVITYDNVAVPKMFVNNTSQSVTGATTINTPNAGRLVLGGWFNGTTLVTTAAGNLDIAEFAMWNRALTTGEVATLSRAWGAFYGITVA